MAPPEGPLQDEPIPTYRIDLSLPLTERYVQLATDFAPQMKAITPLFDEVLQVVIPWLWLRKLVEWLASILLRRVHSAEETKELKGISAASGVELYFLVALNVLLDSLLGCTSGGVMTSLGRRGERGKRLMHFRTLDWGMDPLRNVLVVLEFVRSKSDEPEEIIGRSITYAGFVGMLTGVRKTLSVSPNFRPSHFCSTLALRKHQLLVLLGFRLSVSSLIRNMIIPSEVERQTSLVSLDNQVASFIELRSPPCYLIISDGTSTSVIERDLESADVRIDKEFIIMTNNDTHSIDPENPPESKTKKVKGSLGVDMDSWVEESEERRACVERKWSIVKARQRKKNVSIDGKIYKNGESEGWASVREETLKN